MAKQRFKTIHTSALTSEKLAMLDDRSERLYWRVHLASDAYGTMSGKPWDVLQLAVPGVAGWDLAAVEHSLDVLVGAVLLERWTELDSTLWVHVVGHDRMQSAYYRSKRGDRHTPVPPSERKGEDGSEPESSAPGAELSPSLPPIGIGEGAGVSGSGSGRAVELAEMEDPRLLAALDQVGERFGRREQWAIQARSLFTLLPAALTEDVVGALLACLEPDRKTGKVKHRTAVYDGKFLEAVARRRISDRLTGAAERSASPAESIFDEDELELLEQSGDEHVA